MSDKNKDPIAKPVRGAKPSFLNADKRIDELNDAITRQICSRMPNYALISKYAKEIRLQCKIAELFRKF